MAHVVSATLSPSTNPTESISTSIAYQTESTLPIAMQQLSLKRINSVPTKALQSNTKETRSLPIRLHATEVKAYRMRMRNTIEQRISQRQIVQKDTSSVSSQAAILETLLFRQDPFSQRDLDDQLKELLRAVSRRKLQKAKSCRDALLRSTLGKQRYERLQRLLVLPRPRHLPSSIPASIRELFLKQELKRAVRETPLSELEYVPWDDIMDHTEQLLHDYRAWCRTLPPDTTSCCFSACPLLKK